MLPDPHDALAAFCETVAHVSRVDDGSRSRASEGLWLLDEAVTHQNPFPRSFSFCKSFHALDAPERAPAVVCERVRAWLDRDDEEYVLNVFGADPEALTRAYEATGHMLAWTFDLFARGIDAGAKPASAPAGHRIVPVDSTTLVDAINGHEPEYPSHTTALGDPERSEIAVLDPAGAPVAKGEIVCNVPGFVHVMGMWTLPARRREGLSRVVIGELHRIALERGARHAVLTASLQAARMGLYPKLGYAKVMGAARLVRAEASGR